MFAFLWAHFPTQALSQTDDCVNCFSTELLLLEQDDNCITFKLEINASECAHALSHFSVEIPCGTVTSASNSGGWKMELNSTDPTTGIYGIKVDDIENFGEDGASNTFTLEYTVCASDSECIKLLMSSINMAYKAGQCIFEETIEIANNKLEAYITPTNLLCNGDNSGTITTTIVSGEEPFSYAWSNGSITKDVSGLPAGSYELIITDANGESLTLSTELTQPEALSASAELSHSNCGQNDGYIMVTVKGGLDPYTYNWSNGATTKDIDQLESGQYTLTIADSNACASSFTYNIQSITSLTARVSLDYIECHEEGKGSMEATVSGGTEPYSYLWDNGDTSSVASNLTSGAHKVIISDATGCSIERTGYVIMNKFTASASVINPTCNGSANGSAELTINNGTPPYNILWNTGDTTEVIEELSGGWYWADITDVNGCTYRRYVNIVDPEEITLNASVTRGSCEESDSTILVNLSASGGTSPYTYYQNGEIINNPIEVDSEGYYTFKVLDINGCETIDSVLISRPEAKLNTNISVIQPNCDNPEYGSAYITITDGNAPYTYAWSDGSESASRNPLAEGDYSVIITDAAGCTSEHAFSISGVSLASAEIITPDEMPDCSSTNNLLIAITNNADQYEWSINSSDSSWSIVSPSIDQLIYNAGQDTATISLTATSTDGCTSTDTIELYCNNQSNDDASDGDESDNTNNGDNTNSGDNSDSEDNNDSTSDCEPCYELIPTGVSKIDDLCYTYIATVKTDGTCRYDLSHLTIEVEDGYVQSVFNSKGWKTELNSTDPTTGYYGLKIDDITSFGKTIDEFDLEFTICFDSTPQTDFTVAYKSAQCVATGNLSYGEKINEAELKSISYPNPFNSSTTIEFMAKENTTAELYVYDINGNMVECLYKGSVQEDTNYSFVFTPTTNIQSIFFYKLVCGNEITQGKLIQVP